MSSGQPSRFGKAASAVVFRGVPLGPREGRRIQRIVADRPRATRDELAREICRVFGWVRPNGEAPLRACRALLVRLEHQGWLRLPTLSGRRVTGPARNNEPGRQLVLQAASAPWPEAVDRSAPLLVRPILEPELVGWRAYMLAVSLPGRRPAGG